MFAVEVASGEIQAVLEATLRAYFKVPCRIVGFERRPAAYRTSFALEEIDVCLDTGARLQIMFKDMNPNRLLDEARAAKPEFLRDPHREIEVYSGLLSKLRLGTPTCYGAVADDTRRRHWLFLEKIRGVELYQIGELGVWQDVSRWLARLHTRSAEDPAWLAAVATSHVVTYDADFIRIWPARALEYLRGNRTARHAKQVQALTRLVNAYDRVVEHLLALQRTFLHGEFYASNILVSEAGGPRRVSPVDWEMAAVGPGLIDLAALTSGKWSNRNRMAIAMAYYEALPPVRRPPESAFLESLDFCHLHLAMQWLGWAKAWSPPPEHAQDWLAVSLRLAEKLEVW